MKRLFAVLLTLAAAMAAACNPVPATPASNSPGSAAAAAKPLPRAGAAVAYDPRSRQLILVGGMANPLDLPKADVLPGGDVWAWRPDSGWTRLNVAIVPDAGYMSWLAWDSVESRLLLLSQSSSTVWEWDGKNWSPVSTMPPQHDVISGIAYQRDGGVLRMLARSNVDGNEAMWSWDGSSWTDPEALPMSWREGAVVAYDEARRQLVVYGGYGNGDTATWLYDGTAWSSVRTQVAPEPGQSSSAYDPVRKEVVVHVGGQTWTWDGSSWILRSTAGPGIRRDEAMAFDSAIGKVVLFGGKAPNGTGETYMNDLWAWDGTGWSRIG